MILIIADDLSGAAELAGIAANFGLRSEVHVNVVDPASSAQVIALDTRSRSMTQPRAVERMHRIGKEIQRLRPEWIYKKTDSVLRGYIVPELEALQESAQCGPAVLIPANPGKGRVIRNGEYLVNGLPLNETVFRSDPDFPAHTANVLERLGGSRVAHMRTVPETVRELPAGVCVPEVATSDDLKNWAALIDNRVLPAGAAEYFSALLQRRCGNQSEGQPRSRSKIEFQKSRSLFLCGSLASWDGGIRERLNRFNIPCELYEEAKAGSVQWSERAISAVQKKGAVLMAIGRSTGAAKDERTAANDSFLNRLVEAGSEVMRQIEIGHVLLEGGATASLWMERMGWNRFEVIPADLPGVGILRPIVSGDPPLHFIKPGSYPWPEAFLTQASTPARCADDFGDRCGNERRG